MRTLTCVGTGSRGNCYILDIDGEKLILDAGVKIGQIKKALDWNISGVCGLVTTHTHLDHSLSEHQLEMMGIPVMAPYHNPETAPLKNKFGGFNINAFPVPHDVPNYGFLIRHGDWKMIYSTDFEYLRWTFLNQNLNCMLIECNHISNLLDEESENFRHIVKGHASLDVTEGIVKANSTENLSNVILCHLSDINADEEVMLKRIEAAVPPFCTVSVAHNGETYQL